MSKFPELRRKVDWMWIHGKWEEIKAQMIKSRELYLF
jgi:hypothetical protein